MPSAERTDVIIIGAGPVGLGAALELARFGVRSVVVEKHPGTSWHPKTRNFNTRTMEIALGWGEAVYKRLRAIDTPPGWKTPIRFLDRAIGTEYGKIDSLGFEGPGAAISPAQPVMSSQELIEAIMLDAARASRHVDVRFRNEAIAIIEGGNDDDTQAAVDVRDLATGTAHRLEAQALVAADGAASSVRSALGLRLEGPTELSHVVNCYFRADIEPLLGRTGVLFFVSNDRARGVLQPLDAKGRWLCQINVRPEQWSLDHFTKDRARDWVRAAVGVDDLAVEVLSLGLWQMNATVVEQLLQGRVVICGDAAHQFPPTGGLGVNTGLQGMHNAMWKLALCVKGEAGWPLLATYHVERRGVSLAITQQSLQNSKNVGRIFAAAGGKGDSGMTADEMLVASRRYGNHLGVEFGASYTSAAIIGDGTSPPRVSDPYSDYAPSATPGCRAPHVWLGRADAALSTLHLFGAGFTLLAAPNGEAWCAQALTAARELGVRVDAYRIGGPGLADIGGFAAAYGIGDDGAALVRPDGHVGWRAVSASTSGVEIVQALRQMLAR
jgi:2-polyprenyl-6-methoxyphenol hydroxylase-like FAD-dependent oxidoreductase